MKLEMETLAERVERLRLAASLSQTTLAKAMKGLGFPWYQGTVYRVESGQRKVPMQEVPALAGVLGVKVDDLLGYSVAEPVRPVSVDSLIYLVRSATLGELERLRDAVDTAIAIRSERAS